MIAIRIVIENGYLLILLGNRIDNGLCLLVLSGVSASTANFPPFTTSKTWTGAQ